MEMTIRTGAGALRCTTQRTIGAVLSLCGSVGRAAAADTFAAGILSRHAAEHACVPPMDLALLARPDANVTNVFEMLATLDIRPAFITQLASAMRAPGGTGSPGPTPFVTPPRPTARPSAAAAAARAIFERIFARERRIEVVRDRIESLAVPPAQVPATLWAAEPQRHVTAPRLLDMVPRRAGTPPTPQPPPAPAPPTTAAIPGPILARNTAASGARTPAMAIPLSASDLARLADQVVGAIDRRIVAQRERRGVI